MMGGNEEKLAMAYQWQSEQHEVRAGHRERRVETKTIATETNDVITP
jgi:hypothetical protein